MCICVCVLHSLFNCDDVAVLGLAVYNSLFKSPFSWVEIATSTSTSTALRIQFG